MAKLNLTDAQMRQLQAVAATVRAGDARNRLVTAVLRELAGRGAVSNAQLTDAITASLGTVPMHFNDSNQTTGGLTMTTNTNMARKYRRLAWTDPEAWDEDGILKDGVAVSIPVSLADAKMSEVYDAAQAVRDGRYNRPGWRPALKQDAAALDARAAAYREYEDRVTSAYKDARWAKARG